MKTILKFAKALIGIFENKILFYLIIPFYFIKNLLQVLKNIEKINNKTVFIAWHWSFGHQSQMLETVARVYKKKKKIFLYQIIYQQRNNEYLPEIYNNFYKIISTLKSNNLSLCIINYITLKFIFNFILKNKIQKLILYEKFIDECRSNYKLKKEVYHFDETKNEIIKDYPLQIWVDKILQKYSFKHKFNRILEKKCRSFFISKGIDPKKKIITFFFRDYQQSNTYYDLIRNSYKKNNYFKSINYFSKKNYNVFVISTKGSNRIRKKSALLKNVYFIDEFSKNFDEKLLNIYLFIKSKILVTQNSAPQMLGLFLKKQGYVVDYCPPFFGFPGKTNILFPKISHKNKILHLQDYLKLDFFWGKNFTNKSYIIPNTKDEIFNFLNLSTQNKQSLNKHLPKGSAISMRSSNKIYCSSSFSK